MRELTDHKLNGLNEALEIRVLDEPGDGGAHHLYEVEWPDCVVDPPGAGHQGGHECYIKFQKGPIKEAGTNGLSNESLIAIVMDRLRCFQAGAFACSENALALTKLEESLMWLQKRTRDRMARGVEGTSVK